MIEPFFHFVPTVPESAYVHPRAYVAGWVTLGEHSSIWPGAVLRGDINSIQVGDYSNIQDNSVIHVTESLGVVVGTHVVAGHAVRLHGCTIGDRCLIGIGAVVLDGAVVGEGCIVAAGSLVPERSVLEPRCLYMGSPVRLRRRLDDTEVVRIARLAEKYAIAARSWRAQEQARAGGHSLGEGDWVAALEEMDLRTGRPD